MIRLLAIALLCFAAMACPPMDAHGQCANGQCGSPQSYYQSQAYQGGQGVNYQQIPVYGPLGRLRGYRLEAVAIPNVETVRPVEIKPQATFAGGICPAGSCTGSTTCPASGLCTACSACSSERVNSRLDKIEADFREMKANIKSMQKALETAK